MSGRTPTSRLLQVTGVVGHEQPAASCLHVTHQMKGLIRLQVTVGHNHAHHIERPIGAYSVMACVFQRVTVVETHQDPTKAATVWIT